MWIILDVITVVLLVLSVVIGYKKGLIKTAFGMGILIAALMISYSFSPVLSAYVRTTKQYVSFTSQVKEKLVENMINPESSESQVANKENGEGFQSEREMLEGVSDKLSVFGVELDFDDINERYNEIVSSGAKSAAETLDELIVVPVAKMLCNAICFVILFVVAMLLLHLLRMLLEAVFKLPLLKGMNKISGAVFGLLGGVLKVFVFCTVFQIILPYISNMGVGFTTDIAEKTYIYSAFLNINPLKFLY